MSNEILTMIGIGITLGLFIWRITRRIESRIDRLEIRIDRLEARIDGIHEQINELRKELHKQIDELRKDVHNLGREFSEQRGEIRGGKA